MKGISISIKNMVCNRCIHVVEETLINNDIAFEEVGLGFVKLLKPLILVTRIELIKSLEKHGFKLLDDPRAQLVERIKNLLIQTVYQNNKPENINYSDFLEREIGKEYSSLSALFSNQEGITIEKFIIFSKIERVKELITYNELNLSEIAFLMNYSSVQHLSNQFKKEVGVSPTGFRKSNVVERKHLDTL